MYRGEYVLLEGFMENQKTTYHVDATVDLKWFGLFYEIKKPHLSIVVEDSNNDGIYVADSLTEEIITAMLTENTVLTSQSLNPRYRLRIRCDAENDIILDQVLSIFDYIEQFVKPITYTF